jgi:pyruvate dehydrogenase E1 component alpha subunit/2-oxoisovalerate dehydrogenase E1 component alpha subunit
MSAAEAAVFRLARVLGGDGALLDPSREPPEPPLVLALHRHMRRVRRLDERMVLLQRQGRIGFYGACTGQEAPPVAPALALAPGDWVFPALREGAVLLVRGLARETYLAQAFGSSADIAKGRQMPSHPASRRQRHVSSSSAIGTQLPHAVGAALAARRLGRADVMLAFLGDGATSHPDFHAALNFAGVFRAPWCSFARTTSTRSASASRARRPRRPSPSRRSPPASMPSASTATTRSRCTPRSRTRSRPREPEEVRASSSA